ncbi:MAG: DUF473 domain-containing protein [Methanobacteriota archaeon]|nr:MAG: DUF473 domain-containing protein [Euryarchaeota archaeon]
MRSVALTGISPSVIDALRSGKPRTLELQSAHNVITVAHAAPGDMIFMTSVDMDDLSSGDAGILVQIVSLSITMKRVVEFVQPALFEERERTSARIQVKFGCNSLVKEVETKDFGQPTTIDVVKQQTCYRAG